MTDSAGLYSVGPLNPGDYTVAVTMSGFKSLSVKTRDQDRYSDQWQFQPDRRILRYYR